MLERNAFREGGIFMITAVYLRKSRADRQDESIDDTLQRHRDTLLALAGDRGDTVAAVYEEVVSGDSLYARPEMLRLLEDVSAGRYEGVLCMDIDRLGRGGMSDQGIILDAFKNSGTRIITPRKVYDLNNELDEEYTEFETFLARRELKLIKRRMQRGIRKTVDEGGYLANAPYGYRKTVIDKRPSLEIVPEEGEVVQLIFDLYVKEGAGTPAIAETLNAMGAVPRRGGRFSRSTVRFILRNPVYTGTVVWNRNQRQRKGGTVRTLPNPPEKWVVTPGKHPALVSEALFQQAQKRLSRGPSGVRYDGTCQNPLAGLVFCANCGKKMQRQYRAAAGKPPTLLCTEKGCMVSSPMDQVLEAVMEGLRFRTAAVRLVREPSEPPETAPLEKLAAALEKELDQCRRQKQALCGLLERGVYDEETFRERSRLLARQESEGAEQLAACRERLSRLRQTLPPEDGGEKRLCDLLPGGSPGVQNLLLKALIARIDYYKKEPWNPGGFLLVLTLKEFPAEVSEDASCSDEQES